MLHARWLAPFLMLACACASSPPPTPRKPEPPPAPVVAAPEAPPPADALPMRDVQREAAPAEQELGALRPIVPPEALGKQAPKKK
jgi:hypothetical protein